jgi:hypothetical protein
MRRRIRLVGSVGQGKKAALVQSTEIFSQSPGSTILFEGLRAVAQVAWDCCYDSSAYVFLREILGTTTPQTNGQRKTVCYFVGDWNLEARRFHFRRQSGCSAKRNHARREMKYWEIIADNLSKGGWSLGLRRNCGSGERSSLLTRIATTESVSLCARIKSGRGFSNSNRRFEVAELA